MLGMEQLHHAQVHFATAAEALFKQSMRTKIHIRPRQSAEGLLKNNHEGQPAPTELEQGGQGAEMHQQNESEFVPVDTAKAKMGRAEE
jgi:hypothetical protein